jgi:hypothetical protein
MKVASLARRCGMRLWVVTTCTLLAVVGFCQAEPATHARRDTVLQSDDGILSPAPFWNQAPGVAVEFEAPVWAHSLTAMRFYVRGINEGACTARVYVCEGQLPPGQAVAWGLQFTVGTSDPQWVEVALPEPVNLEDQYWFPGRRFCVMLSWYQQAGFVAVDQTQEAPYATMLLNAGWHFCLEDAFIRAVVSDEYASPVEASSWTRLKALFSRGS